MTQKTTMRFGVLAAALTLAVALLWAASAGAKPGKPVPEDRIADMQLLGVNDFHGNLESPRSLPKNGIQVPVGGAAYLDSYLDEYEARNPERTIRVHAGDMVNASPLISSYFHDEPAVYAMNNMEFDVGTLGNHEFDEGGEELLRLIDGGQRSDGNQFKDGADGQPVNTSDPDFPGASFPYIAANSVYKETGETVLPPTKVIKKDGINVGFIGVTTEDTPNIVVPDAFASFEVRDISDTVNKQVAALKAQKVETIVVLAHAGGFQQSADVATGEIISEASEMSNEVDVVVAGHSHSQLNTRVGDKLVVEAFSAGTAFDAVNMKVDRRTKDVVSSSANIVTTYQDGVAPDAATARLVAEYKERVAPVSERVVGTAAQTITRTNNSAGESALGDLIADAQRDFAGADFAFMNPGGIRADIQSGEVTYGELFTVQPFDNQVVRMELTGEQLHRLLEQQFTANRILQISGFEYSYNSAEKRITSVTLPDGSTLPRDGTVYTVAANSFIATGGDGFTVFKEGRNVQTLGSDLDALEAHVEKLPQPFSAPADAQTRITKEG